MEFRTNFKNRPKVTPEENNGVTAVEKAGYIPTKRRIEDMISAGQRLLDTRKLQYDFEHDKVDETALPDPTRRPGFDLAEATQLSRLVKSRLASTSKGEVAPPPTNPPTTAKKAVVSDKNGDAKPVE